MIAGAKINLKINEEITGSHGLIDGGGVHDDHNYKIIGKLKPTGSVLDRLLLTSVNSVLKIHGLESKDHNSEHKHKHEVVTMRSIATSIMKITMRSMATSIMKIIMKSMMKIISMNMFIRRMILKKVLKRLI